MRLFYAIELDEETKVLLLDRQSEMKKKATKGNFTQKDNLHLTLRFMGEIEEGHFPAMKKILDFIASKNSAFELELTSPGVFERGNKSIVWWGVRKEEPLYSLQKSLEDEIRLNGFPAELKGYNPHITLAREFASNENVKNLIGQMRPLNHTIQVNRISLMESTRVDGKLTYLSRYRKELG